MTTGGGDWVLTIIDVRFEREASVSQSVSVDKWQTRHV